jgi:hypothetical protein
LITAREDASESLRIGNSSVERAALGVEYSDHLDARAGALGGASVPWAGVAIFVREAAVVIFSFV